MVKVQRLIRIIEGVNNMKDTNWILFNRRPSRKNCLGKGKQINAEVIDNKLWLGMTLNGVEYYGYLLQAVDEEE